MKSNMNSLNILRTLLLAFLAVGYLAFAGNDTPRKAPANQKHLQILSTPPVASDAVTNDMLEIPIERRSPSLKQERVAQKIVEAMTRWHYSAQDLTPAMVSEWFNEYFKSLDPAKMLFTKADIDQFRPREANLWNSSTHRVDLQFPFMVYELYLRRLRERALYVRELASKEMSFTVKETLDIDRKKADYPATDSERRELWRKSFKNELLLILLDREKKANGKENTDDEEDEEDPLKDKTDKTLEEEIRDLVKGYARAFKRRAELESPEIFEVYLTSLTMLFDPHSSYMAPAARADFNINMSLSLEGIGATLSSKDGYTTIVEIVPGGPADRDGRLKKGDRIIEVAQDGKEPVDVVEMPLSRVVMQIRGPKGTKVHLTILEQGDRTPKKITIVRDVVELKDREAKSSLENIICADGRKATVLVMHLPSFYCDFDARQRKDPNYKSTTRDMVALLKKGAENGRKLDGVILDLRGNGGGSLEEAISLAGIFNPGETPVVQIRNSSGKREQRRDYETTCHFDGPVLVLTDRHSASASEIVAAALQDMGRAVIMGEAMTHGKGTVQNVVDMSSLMPPRSLFGAREPLGALKLTVAKFYRINGGSTQEKGVVPDIVVPALSDVMETGESSTPHCLPWDEIAPMNFERSTALDALKPILRARSEQRIAKSKEFQAIRKDIAEYAVIDKQKKMPLDIAERRSVDERLDYATKILRNYYRSNTNITEKAKLKKPYPDYVLQEALRVMGDMCAPDAIR